MSTATTETMPANAATPRQTGVALAQLAAESSLNTFMEHALVEENGELTFVPVEAEENEPADDSHKDPAARQIAAELGIDDIRRMLKLPSRTPMEATT